MKQWEPSLFFRVCRLLMRVQILLGVTIFCYNIFFQGHPGVLALTCFGWLIGLAGLVFFILGAYELRKMGRSPRGESFLLTTELVDSGVYAVVRHPQYLGSMLLVSGSILISQHWLPLILGVALLLWFLVHVLPEEDRHLVENFGDNYKRYMRNVPSINFFAGVTHLLRHRKEEE